MKYVYFYDRTATLAEERAALNATGVIEARKVNVSFKVPGRKERETVNVYDKRSLRFRSYTSCRLSGILHVSVGSAQGNIKN